MSVFLTDLQALLAYHIEALVPPTQQPTTVSQAPQRLNGNKEVQFFSVGNVLGRTLVIYMRKRGVSTFCWMWLALELTCSRPVATSMLWNRLLTESMKGLGSPQAGLASSDHTNRSGLGPTKSLPCLMNRLI